LAQHRAGYRPHIAVIDRPTSASERRPTPDRARGLAGKFRTVRDLTEELAAPLSAEDQTAQSMPDVSPTKWHRAHTTWFFETFLLERFEPGFRPYEPAFRMMFNSYYEGVGEQYPRAERGSITRPGAAEVGEYRADVDRRVLALLDGLVAEGRTNGHAGGDGGVIAQIVELGLHHEQQHQELLLMDIKHVLSRNPLAPVYRQLEAPNESTRPAEWLRADGGLVTVGHDGADFSFDNELPRHRVHLEPFEIADRLVTAGEWIDFLADGGYRRPELWLSDGWHTVQRERWEAPLYWQQRDDGWWLHTLGGTRPVHTAEPVCHVSHYEADAFARWAGARLPTEFEWEHARCTLPGESAAFGLDRLHPTPCSGNGAGGALHQAHGDVWQWTSSAYLPYPGFTPAPGAVGEYNGKFMSGQMVLRGGSALTPPGHTRSTYRNFFPPAARWPMTGVRLAR
jgi:ergothioneine biosynthesis protein EgtB